ncbi:MAG TPA: LURP-one-related family protein [Actinomycetota bacterium]|nr:LURP-one-related family protein [Actinomycetota bacterium]
MRYVLKQSLLARASDYAISDESGRTAFVVHGRAFGIGRKLSLKDAAGAEVASVRERRLALRPRYEVSRAGRVAAVVRTVPFTSRRRFVVQAPGQHGFRVTGNFFANDYLLSRGDRRVARVYKELFTMTDTYAVDVADGEDPVVVLATAVVIDLVCHQPGSRG